MIFTPYWQELLGMTMPDIMVSGVMLCLYFLALSGPMGGSRYRMQMVPMMVVYAALAITSFLKCRCRPERLS